MKIVVDTSAIIAVITNEKHKNKMIALTKGADLIAPSCLHWEIGNVFSAMIKRNRVTLDQAMKAVEEYKKIPIRFSDVELNEALKLASKLNLYAYDAYFIGCAIYHKSSLLSLDKGMIEAAKSIKLSILEVIS